MVVQVDVLLHGELADRAVPHTLLGDESQPGFHALIDRGGGDILIPEGHFPGVDLADAGQALGQLALPVARYPGQPDDLTGMDFQVDPTQRLAAPIAHGV